MQTTTRAPHPSSLPLLCLVSSFAVPSPSLATLDPLIELALALIYEDEHPPSLKDWLLRVAAVEPRLQTKKVAVDIEEKILLVVQGGPDKVHDWFHELKNLYPQSDDDEGPINEAALHRASPCALFIRRCRLAFFRLSFHDSVRWWDDVLSWCEGDWTQPDRRTVGTRMAEAYLTAKTRMDYQAARDAMGYYDLDDGSPNQSKPQYALLNMAFLEYELGGPQAARAALSEAVQVARRTGDSRCLIACSSLSKRLQGELSPLDESEESPPALVGSGRPSPTDLLWSVKRDNAAGEPLPLLYATLLSSRALYHAPLGASSKDKGRVASWNDPAWEPSWHAVSAIVWDDLGSPTLAAWREDLALASIDRTNPVWNVRLPVLAQKAAKLTRNGQHDDALQLLFKAVDTRAKRINLGVLEFGAWARQVWDVVRARAESRGQSEITSYITRLSPPSPAHWTCAPSTDAEPSAESLLATGSSFLSSSQPTLALPSLLQALRLSTIRSAEPVRLRCLVRLVECRIALSPTAAEAARTLRDLEEAWGQLLSLGRGSEEDLLCDAREVKARALVLQRDEGGNGDADVVEAAMLVREAITGYLRLHLTKAALRTCMLLAHLYDHLSTADPSFLAQRDTVAREYLMLAQQAESESIPTEEAWTEVGEVEGIVKAVERAVLAGIAGA